MTVEHNTLIELGDITGIEFGCAKCGAKLFYPFNGQLMRIPETCPNCYEPWLVRDNSLHPTTPQTVDAVREMIANFRKMATSPYVKAHVRLQITNDLAKV
jgi:hypothetical protein